MEVLHRAGTEKPKSPRLTNARISRDLETICLKCLEKEPGARYVSAAALADDLERFCAGHTIQARPVGLANRAWRWTRRNPGLAALSVLSVALLVMLAADLYDRRANASERRTAEDNCRSPVHNLKRRYYSLLFHQRDAGRNPGSPAQDKRVGDAELPNHRAGRREGEGCARTKTGGGSIVRAARQCAACKPTGRGHDSTDRHPHRQAGLDEKV